MGKFLICMECSQRRAKLVAALQAAGHHVETADAGRAGIDLACLQQPEVLMADWVLPDLPGLQVVKAVRAVLPEVRGVLLAEFLSHDLATAARQAAVEVVAEEAWDVETWLAALADRRMPVMNAAPVPLAAVVVSHDGRLAVVNSAARELFSQAAIGHQAETFDELLATGELEHLADAESAWRNVQPRAEEPAKWRLRSRRLLGGKAWLVIVRGERQPFVEDLPLTRLLLEVRETDAPRWPYARHALVLATDGRLRGMLSNVLGWSGCVCHAARDREEAWGLFTADPQVNAVIFRGDGFDASELQTLFDRMRAARPVMLLIDNTNAGEADVPLAGLRLAVQGLMVGELGVCTACGRRINLATEPDTSEPACERCSRDS